MAGRPGLEPVVLQCSAINDIDASALDRLKNTEFLHGLSGRVFLIHYQAIHELSPVVA